MGLSGAENFAIGQAGAASAAATRARRDLQSWKEYAAQLNNALADSQIDAARQSVIKEECLRELFLMNPIHRLLTQANRIDVINNGIRAKLIEKGLPELAEDTDRIMIKKEASG